MSSLATDAGSQARAPRRGVAGASLLLLGAITVAGIALRAVSFSDTPFGDELSAYFVVTGNGAGRILDVVESDQEITPPLYFLLASLTQGIGDPLHSLRWVPMLGGIASIPLTYLLGVRTVGRAPGLVGAAIMALSPFLVFFSTEARPYGLMMLLCLGSTLALLRATEGGGLRWWALYAALSCGAMYTHYTAVFLLFGQAAWALGYHRHAWRWLIGANAAAAICWVLPWMSSYRADQDSPGAELIGLLQPFGLDAFRTDVLHWAVGHPLAALPLHDVPGDPALVLLALGLAVGVAGIALEVVRGRLRPPGEAVSLIFVLALSTPVLAGLYSALSVSVFQPRNLIASSPGLALALALIVTRSRRRALWIPATALLVAGFVLAGARMLDDESHRPDYEAVAAFISERGGGPLVTVDSPDLSPGPLTQLDVSFAPGEAEPRGPASLRLARPPRAAQMRAQQPDGPGLFAPLDIPSAASIARRAVRRADGGRLFLVSPGEFTFDELSGDLGGDLDAKQRARAGFASQSAAAAFLRALPDRYRAVETKVLPGLFGYGTLSVYELSPEGGEKPAQN